MKKLSLLVGALGGALAGYLFSNKKLREELLTAKDAENAAHSLGKHLQRDGKKIAAELKRFMESEEVQGNLKKAKAYAREKIDVAKKELTALTHEGAKKAETTMRRGVKKASSRAKRIAKDAARRVHSSTRELL